MTIHLLAIPSTKMNLRENSYRTNNNMSIWQEAKSLSFPKTLTKVLKHIVQKLRLAKRYMAGMCAYRETRRRAGGYQPSAGRRCPWGGRTWLRRCASSGRDSRRHRRRLFRRCCDGHIDCATHKSPGAPWEFGCRPAAGDRAAPGAASSTLDRSGPVRAACRLR